MLRPQLHSRYIFTPAAKSKITLLLFKNGKWTGRRGGIQINLRLGPRTAEKRVYWSARIQRQTPFGLAGTVTEALERIEKAAAVALLDQRKEEKRTA